MATVSASVDSIARCAAKAARRVARIRDRPGYKEAYAKMARIEADTAPSGASLNDTILDIEAAGERRGSGRHRLRGLCGTCGAQQPEVFDSDGFVERAGQRRYFPDRTIKADRQADPCSRCGALPWHRGERPATLNTIEFRPYWDRSLGPRHRCPSGVRYVPGRGHYIRTRAQLRELAALNGRDVR